MQSFYESKYILHWKLELSCSTWLLFVFLVPGCYLYLYVQNLDAICICICKTWLLFVFVFVFLVHTWLLFVFVFLAPGCSCCSKAAPACLPDPCLLPHTRLDKATLTSQRCTHTPVTHVFHFLNNFSQQKTSNLGNVPRCFGVWTPDFKSQIFSYVIT